MTIFRGLALAILLALVPAAFARAADGKIAVVAAENFYGDIARQIGGDRVTVVSIMFMMPIPPTSRLTAAMAANSAVSVRVVPLRVEASSF